MRMNKVKTISMMMAGVVLLMTQAFTNTVEAKKKEKMKQQEEHYTFELSDKVTRERVTFKLYFSGNGRTKERLGFYEEVYQKCLECFSSPAPQYALRYPPARVVKIDRKELSVKELIQLRESLFQEETKQRKKIRIVGI